MTPDEAEQIIHTWITTRQPDTLLDQAYATRYRDSLRRRGEASRARA